MYYDKNYKLAEKILAYKGHLESVNVIRVMAVYEDSKVSIRGFLPLNYATNSDSYQSISVSVNLPPSNDEAVSPMDLTQSFRKDWTVVYIWNTVPLFERPGRWQNYLLEIIKQHETKMHENEKLNRKPVDDSALFQGISS